MCPVTDLVWARAAVTRGAAIAALVLGACAQQAMRPMHEMRGDCADYGWDLRAEFAIAQQSGEAAKVYPAANANAQSVPLGKKLDLELFPTARVDFLVEPERRGKKPEEFAGLIRFVVPQDGMYRVSTGSAYWVEIVDAERTRVRAPKFEMQSQCKLVFKSAAFPLRGNASYWLQVSASKVDRAYLIITPEP